MKLRVSKKALFITLPIVLVAGAAASYFFIFKKDSAAPTTTSPSTASKTEEKTDNVFTYLDAKTDYAKFAAITTSALVKEKLAPTDKGTPQIIIFAAPDSAFAKDDIGTFTPTGADERTLYHFVLLYPAADGTKPSLDLTDGEKLTTLAGRDVLVKKTAAKTTLIDTKGRESVVGAPYVSDTAGNRLYPIDNLLLLQ